MTVSNEETPKTMDTDGTPDGPSPKPSPSVDQQKELIRKCLDQPLKKGDTWYLMDSRWLKQWERYVGYDNYYSGERGQEADFPGPIDNSNLFKDKTKSDDLRDHMMEEVDYNILPASAWHYFVEWYHLVDGQEPISRIVREHGLYVKDLKVEVYLTKLKLCLNSDTEDCVVKRFSKTATLEDVMTEMKTAFKISESKDTRLWNKYMSNTYELLTNSESTIQDAGLYDGQVVVMEQQNEDGTWPRQTRSSSISSTSALSSSPMESSSTATGFSAGSPASPAYTSYGMSYGSTSYGSFNDDARRRRTSSTGSGTMSRSGQCGLSNLGNTCFMNSSLQCLSNTAPLVKYFLAGNYKKELNPQNPLGMRGEIAIAYAELMMQMWSGYNSYVSPRNFKVAVGRFAPQFSGYQQQDSHELLAFLLDGLHEDLNRVKKKPYVEIPDHDGRPDKEIAQEAWSNHNLRNCSIIVDLFHGLFKSTVVCPICSKISVTFDPFCYLSLPLPVNKERSLNVVFVPLEPEKKPVLMKATVPKVGTINDLAIAVSRLTGADAAKLVVADVYSHRFHKIFERRDALSHVTDRDDIYVYEIPVSIAEYKESELIIVPVYLRIKRSQTMNSYSYGASASLFGIPMLVPIPRKGVTYDDLYQIILRSLKRVINTSTEKEETDKETEVNGASSEDDEVKIKDDTEDKETEEKGDTEMDTETTEKKESKKQRIFSIKSVNSYGSSDIDPLSDDGKELQLSSKMYLALDWDPKSKKVHFNDEAAEETEEHGSIRQKAQQKKTLQLQDCLDLFLTKEKLGAEDPWYCPTCKEHQQASKKFDLWALPTVLVIHLKRFSYNRWWRDKLDSLVEFPIRDLNLTPYVINKGHPAAVYDLHAVSNHYGGMGGGHYTAYAKNAYDGKWYYFDDSSVSSADESQIVSKAAYVLFYTRRKDPSHPPQAVNELLSDDENAVFPAQDASSDEGEFDMET